MAEKITATDTTRVCFDERMLRLYKGFLPYFSIEFQ